MRLPSAATGLLLGAAFSLVLNIGAIAAVFSGTLSLSHLGGMPGSPDELYYFAQIRDTADGHWNLGNASLKEFADAPSVAGYAVLPQGALMAVTGWSIETVVLLGDLFFCALLTLFAFLIFRRVLGSDLLAGLASFAFMTWWSTVWLRTMNPQVTFIAFLLHLFVFVSDRDGKRLWLRSALLGLLYLMQPIFAVYALVIEVLDACLHRSWRRWQIPLVLGAVALGQWVLVHFGADPEILADTYRRRGLIPSHLPAAFSTQVWILLGITACFLCLRWKKIRKEQGYLLLILLVGGLIVLNQSLLHGYDIVFGLYYRFPLAFVLWLSAVLMLRGFVPLRLFIAAAVLTFIVASGSMVRELARPAAHDRSDFSGLLHILNDGKDRVILAPIEISNLIPVQTSHYALFTQYAHFEYAPDQDLAERYLLQQSFFPLPAEMTVDGDPLVFGIYAGNIAARANTACRLRNFLLRTSAPCNRMISGSIYRQDVRSFIEAGKIDQRALLKKFAVETIVTDRPLPAFPPKTCWIDSNVGKHVIYNCLF